MWLSRCLELLRSGDEPIVLACSFDAGVGHLIRAFDEAGRPLVWLELAPEDKDDPVAQGNKLADALSRTFGSALLAHGLTVSYGLAALKNSRSYLEPFTLALSEAQHAPELSARVLELNTPGCRVLVQMPVLPPDFSPPFRTLFITTDMLKLKRQEAIQLAEGRVSEAVADAVWRASGGHYDRFMTALHERLLLPSHLLPGPEGMRPLPGAKSTLNDEALLDLLIKRKRWLAALEVAAHKVPVRVPEVLREAGHHYHEQGLHGRLHVLLDNLPEKVRRDQTVLFWRLQAAFRLGRGEELRDEVETYLAANEAPELRALYAGVLATPETSLAQAERAYMVKQTPFTAFQAGRLTYEQELGVERLRESVRLAELSKYPYEVARNAGALASKLIFQGAYHEAVDWGRWALQEFDRHGVKDGQRRLSIVNDWSYARLVTGEVAGLEALLKEHEALLTSAYPSLARLFRSTLGDYLVASSRPLEALHYYRINLEQAGRQQLGGATLSMVRAHLELSEVEEAVSLAERSFNLLKNEPEDRRAEGQLAMGMALSLLKPSSAREHLGMAKRAFTKMYGAHYLARVGLYLALAYMRDRDVDAARSTLEAFRDPLQEVSPLGLRLFSGPEDVFRDVWSLLLGQTVPLELRFLGTREVWLNGKKLDLFPQWTEILAVLAIRGKPLTLETLLADLSGDNSKKATLKASLSKLRRVVPVSSHPYRIEVEYRADFLDVLYYLRRENLRGAVNLYGGPLLESSDAPLVRSTDEEITEALRQASLSRNDVESLLRLSERFLDDLEICEAALDNMKKSDPRAPSLKARVEKVRRGWLS